MARQGQHGIGASKKGQAVLRQLEKQQLEQQKADMRELLHLPAGRRFLIDLIERRSLVGGAGYDAAGSLLYFREGQRVVGARLRAELEAADPAAYCEMVIEAIKAAAELAKRRQMAEQIARNDDEDVVTADDGGGLAGIAGGD